MNRIYRQIRPNSDLVDDVFRFIFGLADDISTLELYKSDPGLYSDYCSWHANREEYRRIGNPKLPLTGRIAAYLRLIPENGQRFRLGFDAVPSSNWLRERLGIHRNTLGKYIKDAQTTGQVHLSLNVGCQLAFAAGIYPPQSKLEKNEVKGVMENRLDLIDDYHITGNSKVDMVRSLTPIVRNGRNNLFTAPKSYPFIYDLDEKMRPMKYISQHIARKAKLVKE